MPSKIADLVRTAPDWARVDPQSAEVVAWLHRAHQVVKELEPVEVDIFRVHLQHLDNDVLRHGTGIVEVLRRVEGRTKKPRAG